MEISSVISARICALLFVSGSPCSRSLIKKLLTIDDTAINNACVYIAEVLQPLGLTLIVNEKDLALTTNKDVADVVTAYIKHEREGDLTPSALQVLTLVAYLDAPTKHDISYIRGIVSTQSIKNLLVRGLIEKNASEGYILTVEALAFLGVTKKEELKDYERIHTELLQKVKEAQEEE